MKHSYSEEGGEKINGEILELVKQSQISLVFSFQSATLKREHQRDLPYGKMFLSHENRACQGNNFSLPSLSVTLKLYEIK
jgi:hypothetical protein